MAARVLQAVQACAAGPGARLLGQALAAVAPFLPAGQVPAALAEARRAVFAGENELEWGTPVLYMRCEDGRVFEMEAPETPLVPRAGPAPQPPPPQGPAPAAPGRAGAAPCLGVYAFGFRGVPS